MVKLYFRALVFSHLIFESRNIKVFQYTEMFNYNLYFTGVILYWKWWRRWGCKTGRERLTCCH